MEKEKGPFYEFGTFRLDVQQRKLTQEGRDIALTPKVFDVLLLLVQNSGNVLEKGQLMKAVWPESFVEEGNLSQNVFVLRKILGDDENGNRFIQTIPRRGYKFLPPVKRVDIPTHENGPGSIDLVGKDENGARHELLTKLKREPAKPDDPPSYPGKCDAPPQFPPTASNNNCVPQQAPNSLAQQVDVVEFTAVITGTITIEDVDLIEAIVEHLRKRSKDASLTLLKARRGSVVLLLRGSRAGFQELERLHKEGLLNEVHGCELLGVAITMHEDNIDTDSLSIDYTSAYEFTEDSQGFHGPQMAAQDAIVLGTIASDFEVPSAVVINGMVLFTGALIVTGRNRKAYDPLLIRHPYTVINNLNVPNMFGADRVIARVGASLQRGGDIAAADRIELIESYFTNLRVAVDQFGDEPGTNASHDSSAHLQFVNILKRDDSTIELLVFMTTISPSRQQLKELEDSYDAFSSLSKVTDKWTTQEIQTPNGVHILSGNNNFDINQSGRNAGRQDPATRTLISRSGVIQLVKSLVTNDLPNLVTSIRHMKLIPKYDSTGGGGGPGYPG